MNVKFENSSLHKILKFGIISISVYLSTWCAFYISKIYSSLRLLSKLSVFVLIFSCIAILNIFIYRFYVILLSIYLYPSYCKSNFNYIYGNFK